MDTVFVMVDKIEWSIYNNWKTNNAFYKANAVEGCNKIVENSELFKHSTNFVNN